MKKQDGIALIASLLIMAAIMALGVGTLFLSTMNLRIAENSRTHAVARYNAEAGLEAAIVKLNRDYKDANPDQFPSSFTPPTSPDYQLSTYTPYPAIGTPKTQARVVIIGTGPNNARYVAEALVNTVAKINPAFLIGLASPGRVNVSGGGNAEFVNAGIHGDAGVSLSGFSSSNFRTCATPTQEFSTCTVANPLPVSSSNGASCSLPGCDLQAPELEVDPAYVVKRNDAIAINTFGLTYYLDADGNKVSDRQGGHLYADPASPSMSININPEVNPTVYNNRCTVVYSSTNPPPATIPAVAPGARICAKDGLNLNFASGINMTDVTVIADGNITFGGATNVGGTAGVLTNTKLISRTRVPPTADPDDPNDGLGGVMLDNVTGHNLTLFSGANRDITESLTGNKAPHYLIGSGFKLTGSTTIASNRDIEFSGQTQLTTYPDKPGAVTAAIISTRQITNNGSGDFYGVFLAGTCFSQKGSARIVGSVAVQSAGCKSGNAIDISGKLHINSSYAVENSSLYGPPKPTVASRR